MPTVLVINAILYIVFTFYLFIKYRELNIHNFMWIIYSIISVLGVVTVSNGVYFDTFGTFDESKLSFAPYLLAFSAFLLFFAPLNRINSNKLENNSIVFNKSIDAFVTIWMLVFVAFSFLKASEAIISISSGLADAYESRHMEGESLFHYDPLLAKFNGYGTFFLNSTTPFIMSYAIIGMYKGKISEGKSLLLMFLCFFPTFCNAIGIGSRGGVFMEFFGLLFFLLIYRKMLSYSFKRKIYLFVGLTISVVLSYSLAITYERVGEGNEGLLSIERYFGEPFPNLGWQFWEHVNYNPMGKRLFPDIVNYSNNFASTQQEFDYWTFKTNVPVAYFKTLFGDLYIEFGMVGAFVIISIFSYILLKLTRDNINVLKLNYIYFYFQICVFGFAGFTKSGHNATFSILIIIITNLMLSYLMFGKLRLK